MSGGEFWGHYGSKEEVINRLTGQRRLDKKPLNWVLKDENECPRKISEEKAFHKQETLCVKI